MLVLPGSPPQQRRMGEPASLVFWNRPITVFRAYNEEVSPAERAAKAAARLADIPAEASEWNVVANETSVGQYSGAIVTVNGQLAFGIMTEDLDRESGETLSAAMDKATTQLRSALEARSQQRRFPGLVRSHWAFYPDCFPSRPRAVARDTYGSPGFGGDAGAHREAGKDPRTRRGASRARGIRSTAGCIFHQLWCHQTSNMGSDCSDDLCAG